MCNQVDFSGKVIKVYPVKETPNGVRVLSFTIQHSSRQVEAQVSREVKCRLFCVMLGVTELTVNQLKDQLVQVSGFLSQNAKSEIVLHVKKIVFVDKGI